MSHQNNKRSRTTYESDHSHAPYATFGTPLPDEADTRDDGSFVPVWKQEVRDERGRKRLHGAFTGGFSAGYFNTVGSKEGWAPSTFVSSRSNRRKDDAKQQRRPEDYMDDEDLADAAEAQKLYTSEAFAGLGSSTQAQDGGGLNGLLRPQGDTMGFKLLRKMGWKDGQGIGPKVRRGARLDLKEDGNGELYAFAPDDVPMIQFVRKTDRTGLGHDGETKLSSSSTTPRNGTEDADEEPRSRFSLLSGPKKKTKPAKGGIGMGILNDNGSDEEDPYEMGPKISYNRTVGGDKKKKKAKTTTAVNPSLNSVPVFLSRTARAGNSLQRCHDGRLPLDGFVLAKMTTDFDNLMSRYAPPEVPSGWVSKKLRDQHASISSSHVSASNAAKASTLDAKARAALLGEKMLPGKSVFDFMSQANRDKLAAATGRADLPQGRGEVPEEFRLSEDEKQQRLWQQVPKLDQETALAALARSSSGPYADDEAKRARYRGYLECLANSAQRPLPKPAGMSDADYIREMNDFYNCARIFKPMTGFMASRFTTSKTLPGSSGAHGDDAELVSRPEPKATDPAEEAAKMGMYGQMTRSIADFHPTRLLCKRFNVKPPANSAEQEGDPGAGAQMPAHSDRETRAEHVDMQKALPAPVPPTAQVESGQRESVPDPEENKAIEGGSAHAEVLKAIFGDSDSE